MSSVYRALAGLGTVAAVAGALLCCGDDAALSDEPLVATRAAREHASDRQAPAPPSRAWRRQRAPASVVLPSSADRATWVEDAKSGVAVGFAPTAAEAAPARATTDGAEYPRAIDGADLVLRIRHDGVEDYLVMAEKPPVEQLRYRVELRRVAGLRKIGSVVEMLDAGGAPRLRIAPPYLLDARGRRHAASIEVEGCAVDRDPAPPWRRRPLPPAGSSCVVRIAWGQQLGAHGEPVSYPATLDPAWVTTADMIEPRQNHTATLLDDGTLLVAGMMPLGAVSAERYDPASDSWAATGAMAAARRFHVAVPVEGGSAVLVIGGRAPCDGCAVLSSAERYDSAAGTFTTTAGAMLEPRMAHAAAALGDETVLVAGGRSVDLAPYTILGSSEVWVPATESFIAAPAMAHARMDATLTTLQDGTALAVGGQPGALATERFDSSLGWLPAGDLQQGRYAHSAFRTMDGRVIVVGGNRALFVEPVTLTQIFDPAAVSSADAWTTTGDLLLGHFFGSAALLPGDRLLALGYVATPELFDPLAGDWSLAPDMPRAVIFDTTTTLPGGDVLVAGGIEVGGSGPLADTLRLSLTPNGQACARGVECASLYCVGGICCDGACDVPCHACTAMAKGGGLDGVCEPVAAGLAAPDGRCSPVAEDTCGTTGLCAAAGACALAAEGTACDAASCEQPGTCDGDGACVCAPACNADGTQFGQTSCAPYRCDAMLGCLSACSGSNDCVQPYLCDRTGHCISASDPSQSPSCDCLVASRGGEPERARVWALAIAWAALGSRRRRRP